MINPTEIIPGVLFYSYYASTRKEKIAFMEHNTLVLQVSGRFTLETAEEKFSMGKGEMILIRKNQFRRTYEDPFGW